MAGTLTISTLSDGTNSTSATNCISGSAKAWVNFSGTTSPGTIRASYNVSSVTRNSTGLYTVNMTNAMTDANYVTTIGASTINGRIGVIQNGGTYTTSAVQVGLIDPTTGSFTADSSIFTVAIFR